MNTITPAELLSLVIQYAELTGSTTIDEHLIDEVVRRLLMCGKAIADYREHHK